MSTTPKVTFASLKAELDALRATHKAEIDVLRATVEVLLADVITLKANSSSSTVSAVDTPKTPNKRGEKKERAPDAPKKPLSGYILFTLEKRPVVKAEHPEMDFGQIGAELGRRWKALSDEEKESYKSTLNTYIENKGPIEDIIDAKITQV